MSFQREIAKALLRELVSDRAEQAANHLRASARRACSSWAGQSKRGLAEVGDAVSEDPDPVVELIEMWWDRRSRESPIGRMPSP